MRCYTTLNTIKELPQPGETATLYTYLNVKEDALDLYGFYTPAELEIYKILIGVNGLAQKSELLFCRLLRRTGFRL